MTKGKQSLTVLEVMRGCNFWACKIGLNEIFVIFVLTIFDQYHSIGPKILVPFQNLKNIGQKNIGPF